MAQAFHVIRDGLVYELEEEEEGGYTITVPSLPGCVSYGSTFEEAMEMIVDALIGWVAVAEEEGIPVSEAALRLARATAPG